MKRIHLNRQQFLSLHPCPKGVAFVKRHHYDFHKAWAKCRNGEYMLWLLIGLPNIYTDQVYWEDIKHSQQQICCIHRGLKAAHCRNLGTTFAKEIRKLIGNPFLP